MRVDGLKSKRFAVSVRVGGPSRLDEYPANLVVHRHPIRKVNPSKDLFSYRPHPRIGVLDNDQGGRSRNWDSFTYWPRLIQADSELLQTLVTHRLKVHRYPPRQNKE
jgi:hypothetical protein